MDLWLVTAALASACTVSVQHSRTARSRRKTEIEALGLLLYEGPLTRLYRVTSGTSISYLNRRATCLVVVRWRGVERPRRRRRLLCGFSRKPWSSASTLIKARIIALLFVEANTVLHRYSNNASISVVKLNRFITIDSDLGGSSNNTSDSLRILNRASSAKYCSIS